ncbi:TatD family hydrolase [Patescibacteria group bacterium]|nr:TatD family hydrolase [Patescibacteria group bacterium]MBU1966992.1 TatD family hydrolase [Patescibacteria group bacterium]MBU2543479.1 TatD family hydrolase [Patescibacteria group bacterium]
MIIDTHCHYNLPPLYEHWQDHWKKAQDHGITQSIIPGTNIETSQNAVEIAQHDKNLFATVGVHPHEYNQIHPDDLSVIIAQHVAALSMLLDDDKNVISIGETGLDYYRLKDEQREIAIFNQQAAFKMHIQLANKFKKILVIHSRDKGGDKKRDNQGYWDILKIIKNDYQHKKPLILHCISGPKEYLKEALELGAYIGIGANVTYPDANELRTLIAIVPQDRLLLETDAPYLPPQEFRGQTCEPWMIKKTAQFLRHLGMNLEQIYQNFNQLRV